MKRMKAICLVLAIMALCALLSACRGGEQVPEAAADSAKYTELEANGGKTVTIPTAGITQNACFFNYDADGVTVQLVALRDKNDGVHIAFNTCQSCSPSPKAYYEQSGSVLQCANCGFTFEPEQVGITHGGCNPWPIDGVVIGEKEITVPVSALDDMKGTFTSWAGPTK